MIRTTKSETESIASPIFFRPHFYATQLLGTLHGVEIGAGAHNSFELSGSINVAPWNEDLSHPWRQNFEAYRGAQIEMCGRWAEVDLPGTADIIPVQDESQDYVISSHVIEHVPSPVSALLEWDRVLKPGGYIFMIYPKRDSLPADAGRPISEVADIISAFAMNKGKIESGEGHNGHAWRFTPDSMRLLVQNVVKIFSLDWRVIYEEITDTKVGNGHTIVIQKSMIEGE